MENIEKDMKELVTEYESFKERSYKAKRSFKAKRFYILLHMFFVTCVCVIFKILVLSNLILGRAFYTQINCK